jgi:hypothetical protein
MEITPEIVEKLAHHFAKEWGVKRQKLDLSKSDISIVDTDEGPTFQLEFTIDWDGSYETYWGEISYNELISWWRNESIKKIGI